MNEEMNDRLSFAKFTKKSLRITNGLIRSMYTKMDKLYTHSFQGYTTYIKNSLLNCNNYD